MPRTYLTPAQAQAIPNDVQRLVEAAAACVAATDDATIDRFVELDRAVRSKLDLLDPGRAVNVLTTTARQVGGQQAVETIMAARARVVAHRDQGGQPGGSSPKGRRDR